MRKKIYKIIRIKITILVVALVLFFVALQTPWLKRVIANNLISKLSEITQSEVSIKSYEGFIPLNFDFYQLSFKQDDQEWLVIDRLSLNRTLLRFFFWKNRGIDVSLIHPHLLKKPELIQEESPNFHWPELPFQKLSIQFNCYQIEIDPLLTSKTLPRFNAFSTVHIRRAGEALYLDSYLNAPQLPNTDIRIKLDGEKKQNQIVMDLAVKELNQEVLQYFIDKEIPEFSGRISLRGNPQSLIAFFHPAQEDFGSFEGEIKGNFLPGDQTSEFLNDFLDEKSLDLFSKFHFLGTEGLYFNDLHIEASHLLLEGNGRLNRAYEFNETTLHGEVNELVFLSPWIHEVIEGKIELSSTLNGPIEHPEVDVSFTSSKLETDYIVGEDLAGEVKVQKRGLFFDGELSFKGRLNHLNSSFKTDFSLRDFKTFSFKDLNLQYGENSLFSSRFKSLKEGEILQGNLSFNFGDLSLFSPFFKQALHGNVKGHLTLDLDPISTSKKQKVDLLLEGDHFEMTWMELNPYYFHAEGNLDLSDYYNFDGSLFFKSQSFNWRHYEFENIQLVLNPKNRVSPYKLEMGGQVALSSSGQIARIGEQWNLTVRLLKGSLYRQALTLSRPIALQFSQKELLFSPLDLRVGPGSLFLNLDSEAQKLQALTEKFPIEVMALFIPKFDIKGFVDLNGSLSELSSDMQGKVSGSVYQFSIEDYHNMPPFKGVFDLQLEKGELLGKASFYERKLDRGTLDFKLPLHLHYYPLKAAFDLEKEAYMDLRYKGMVNPFIQLLLPQNHLLEGKTEVSFQLKGPLEHPQVTGFASLNQGYYENLYLGLVLKNISSRIEAKGDTFKLQKFVANDDLEGQVVARGEATLDFKRHLPFDLQVDLDQGRVIQFDFLDATFNGGISLKGSLERAKLKGDLDILQANVTIPSHIGSGLPKLPVSYLYPREARCASQNKGVKPFIPIDYDLHLDVANKVTLKGRGLDTVWGGKLDIKGDSRDPLFEGKLKNVEGTFVFAGKVLKLDEGLIQFDGDILKKTYINLIGTTQIHNAKIMAYLQGPFMGPKLTFRSDPPYSQTEILSLVLFNESVQKLTPFQAVALTHSLATLSGTYLGPDIIDKVRRGIGVDQLTFGSSIEKGGDYTTIQVGKYITRHVLITLNRPLSTGASPFVITAHIKGGVELQTYFDENEISKISIQWKLSY